MIYIWRKSKKISRWALFCLFFNLLLVIGLFGYQVVLADYQEPTAQPPESNMPGYLNIGKDNQARSGSLRLGTDDTTSPFYYQLEVLGAGSRMSSVELEKNLKVRRSTGVSCTDDGPCGVNEYCDYDYCRADTLFVDAQEDKVCLGPCLSVAGSKLEISGGGVSISGVGTGLSAVSSDDNAVYGQGTNYGIQGLAAAANNFGVLAENTLGTAVVGENTSNTYSSVAGFSINGFGVYGYNECGYSDLNCVNSNLWAGYFEGRVESSYDVDGAKILPTTLQPSIVPFTSGQTVASYEFSNLTVKLFDGTFIWAVDSTDLYKIRAADGFKVFNVSVGSNPSDVIFDGNFIWVSVAGSNLILKINPYSGSYSGATIEDGCSLDLGANANPQGIVFDGQYYWVSATQETDGVVYKINNLCGKVDINGDSDVNNDEIVLTNFTYDIGKIIYNGSYLWVLATSNTSGQGAIIIVNPSNQEALRWDGLVGNEPQALLYDNYNYWVANYGSDTVTKFHLSDSKICSQSSDTSCTSDNDCGEFEGACFAVPVSDNTSDYSAGDGPANMIFDGTYVWVANSIDQTLTRLLAAFPEQSQSFSLGFVPQGLVYDTQNVWLSSGTSLVKKFSGTGFGKDDLSDTLTLQLNSTLIRQTGDFSIDDSGRVGGDTTVQGDLDVSGNVWGGDADSLVDVEQDGSENCGGTANCFKCPGGEFIKNVITNSDGEVVQLECRPL